MQKVNSTYELYNYTEWTYADYLVIYFKLRKNFNIVIFINTNTLFVIQYGIKGINFNYNFNVKFFN